MQNESLTTVWKKNSKLTKVGKFSHVLHFFRQAFRSVVISPFACLICLLTVAAAMTVLNCFLLLVINISDVVEDSELSCRIYLKDKEAKDLILDEIASYKGVENVKFISEDDALQEFKQSLGEDLIVGLESDNPLPASLLVTVAKERQDLISALAARYKDNPSVEYVQYDQQFVQKFTQAILLIRRLIFLSVLALVAVTAVIIANTVRMTLSKREEEIVIMRLVGAESFDVITPCVIEGALYGFLGSTLGLLLAYLVWLASNSLITDLAFIKLIFSKSIFISPLGMFFIVFSGGFVGALSSFAAVSKVSEK